MGAARRFLMSDYASLGLVAVAMPQANTTVESEMAVLLKPGLGLATVRLYSQIADARARLVDYLDRLAPALDTLDTESLYAKLADVGWRARLTQRFPQALEGLA